MPLIVKYRRRGMAKTNYRKLGKRVRFKMADDTRKDKRGR